MECYTSDSGDSDIREQRTLNLSNSMMETKNVDEVLEECASGDKKACEDYEVMILSGNKMTSVPGSVCKFMNLKVLDISNNHLTTLPDILKYCPLASLTAKHNLLTNESFPKSFFHSAGTLKELNFNGNRLTSFPEQILELTSLKYLFLGANYITSVPWDIWKLSSLQIMMLGGNMIVDIPESVGELKLLQMLVLSENLIEQLPASIGKLNNLKCLRLHNNRLRTLPTEIITLKCLSELSLRDNPLVVRFVRDITLQPPSLLELAGRAVKLHGYNLKPGDIPTCLMQYLDQAQCCVNPKCKGVFFDSRVEHIKFVDFCGKYRLPLLQYLCSSKCATGTWESREHDPVARGYMMKKVLLG